MTAIEQQQAAFDDAGITVLPIVMSTREQITADMRTYGTRSPFLLDDGTVSRAYGTLGKGMHAGLPGHSFVLIDGDGIQRWFGEYPSMWLAPDELLTQVQQHLPCPAVRLDPIFTARPGRPSPRGATMITTEGSSRCSPATGWDQPDGSS